MIPKRKIHPKTIQSYRQTIYQCLINDQEFQLEIGTLNPSLANVMKKNGMTSAAYLTAYNPYSEQLTQEQNLKNQLSLVADIEKLNFRFFHGEGRPINNAWPVEQSILVFGISQLQADRLADHYLQHGYLWIGSDAGIVSLRLRSVLADVNNTEIIEWVNTLPETLRLATKNKSNLDLWWLMAAPENELVHWLDNEQRNFNQSWPLIQPDGSAFGNGTELDRIFKLVASGIQRFIE